MGGGGPDRSRRVAIGFMVVWIVFWAAGIFIVLFGLISALRSGNLTALAFMLVWLAAAGFGLFMGVRKLRDLWRFGKTPPRPVGNHVWDDDTAA
jgi:uncharacterized membrane protein YhaH (DUF805 family)